MQTFEIKIHQRGNKYNKPHFFILNQGLNSGKPFSSPCPHCFVVITETDEYRKALFYLSFMLLESKCYRMILKGTLTPFFYLEDVKTLLIKNEKYLNESAFESRLETLKRFESLEILFENKLHAIRELKKEVMDDHGLY
ncbi:MAG TPA: hypothetical protein VF985_02160 [Mariniflexile sp.]|jgi:hypothetical protein